MDKLKMQTPDLTDKNIERIASLFPNVITETKDESGAVKKAIDFDLLKQALSKALVEDDNERYRLDWPGKKASLLKANTPIIKTLRPFRNESVNFDTTENLYIEGDNFEVLKILQESYLGKVKMIYIDPPYNRGSDLIYKDDFAAGKEAYEEELGATDEEGGKLFRNTDSNGRYHSDWLSMMYERLLAARDLLKDDGVIFISIDDNEVHNLRKICDEVFGEENIVGQFVWVTKNAARGVPPKTMLMENHEYVIAYAKFAENIKFKGLKRDEEDFSNPDNDPRGLWRSESIKATGSQDNYFTIVDPETKNEFHANWAFSQQRVKKMIEDKLILFPDKSEGTPRQKKFIDSYLNDKKAFVTNLGWFSTENATKDFMNLFDQKKIFDFPKPLELISFFVNQAVLDKELVVDFFSGSSTTAHAVMQLNAEDGLSRRFIMVQFPEKTEENSEAYKAGYKTIAEIGKERIRRAGKKIVEEVKARKQQPKLGEEPVNPSKLDIGFRVYKTDDTNMKDVFYHPAGLKQEELFKLESNIKEDRTPEDLLTQVIIDLGLELSLPVETKKMLKNTVFIVQTNALVACFDNDIDFKIVDIIANLKPFKVVFKDASFKDDKDRINVEERFKRLSSETKVTVI